MSNKKTILVIDESIKTHTLIRNSLDHNYYNIICTDCDNKGVDLFKRYPVDIVLTDFDQPENEKIVTIGKIKNIEPTVQIVAMTRKSHKTSKHFELAHTIGASETLAKPFSTEELVKTIKRL